MSKCYAFQFYPLWQNVSGQTLSFFRGNLDLYCLENFYAIHAASMIFFVPLFLFVDDFCLFPFYKCFVFSSKLLISSWATKEFHIHIIWYKCNSPKWLCCLAFALVTMLGNILSVWKLFWSVIGYQLLPVFEKCFLLYLWCFQLLWVFC